jgi:hypothetical protein
MSACRSCGAGVLWAETQSGKRVPLDVELCDPTDKGAQIVARDGSEVYVRPYRKAVELVALRQAVSEQRARELVAEMEAHLTHFATCEYADQHRARPL